MIILSYILPIVFSLFLRSSQHLERLFARNSLSISICNVAVTLSICNLIVVWFVSRGTYWYCALIGSTVSLHCALNDWLLWLVFGWIVSRPRGKDAVRTSKIFDSKHRILILRIQNWDPGENSLWRNHGPGSGKILPSRTRPIYLSLSRDVHKYIRPVHLMTIIPCTCLWLINLSFFRFESPITSTFICIAAIFSMFHKSLYPPLIYTPLH